MLFLESLVMGFLMAIPVGPSGVLSIRRSLKKGWRSGFVTGFAVALTDGLFALICSFGLQQVEQELKKYEQPTRLIGGLILVIVAWKMYTAPPAKAPKHNGRRGRHLIKDFLSAWGLALSNPMAIFSFAAVYISLGLGAQVNGAIFKTLGFAACIIIGSSAWFALLCWGAVRLREKLSAQVLRRTNQGCAALVAFFAVYMLARWTYFLLIPG